MSTVLLLVSLALIIYLGAAMLAPAKGGGGLNDQVQHLM